MRQAMVRERSNFQLPERIEVIVECDGQPIIGLFATIRIETTYKNSFHSIVGPSDSDGRILVTRDELIAEANRDSTLFIMDYGDAQYDYAGRIVVAPLSRGEIDRALDAHSMYQSVTQYPTRYAERLRAARAAMQALDQARLKTVVSYCGGIGEVISSGVAANGNAA